MKSNNDHNQPLVILSPNLAVDHIIELNHFSTGDVQRCRSAYLSAGGKGINVARAFKRLGGRSTIIGLVGGKAGQLMCALLKSEGLDVESPSFTGETRFATIIVDLSENKTTVINEPGPIVDASTWDALVNLVEDHIKVASIVVCTGSLPPGVNAEGYGRIIRSCNATSKITILDASGPALAAGAASGPSIIKVNLEEAYTLLPREDPSVEVMASWQRAIMAATQLRSNVSRAAIVTVAEGAALCCDEATAFYSSAIVRVQNDIGAGDSFVAGFATSLASRDDLVTACRYGVAIAAASVETSQPGNLDVARAEELAKQIGTYSL